MKKNELIYIIFIFFLSCNEKRNELDYQVFQFQKNDSINGYISKIVRYNNLGKIEFEKYNNHLYEGIFKSSNSEITHYYQDTLLVKSLIKYFEIYKRDSGRLEFYYNEKRQLVKKKDFLKVRLRKKDSYDGCIVDSTNFEKNPIWMLDHTEEYKYDNNNKVTEKYIPEHFKGQNRFVYQYDKQGRIINETSYREKELAQEKFYEYIDNGCNLTSKGSWTGYEEYRYKTNENRKIIQETKKWRDKQQYRIEYKYDNKNRIKSEKYYNENDEIELTYIYLYEN